MILCFIITTQKKFQALFSWVNIIYFLLWLGFIISTQNIFSRVTSMRYYYLLCIMIWFHNLYTKHIFKSYFHELLLSTFILSWFHNFNAKFFFHEVFPWVITIYFLLWFGFIISTQNIFHELFSWVITILESSI